MKYCSLSVNLVLTEEQYCYSFIVKAGSGASSSSRRELHGEPGVFIFSASFSRYIGFTLNKHSAFRRRSIILWIKGALSRLPGLFGLTVRSLCAYAYVSVQAEQCAGTFINRLHSDHT